MESSASFQQILEGKMGKFSTENETSYIKNYVPGLYDIPVLGLKTAKFASGIKKTPYRSSVKIIAEPFVEPKKTEEPKVKVSDFSSLATVAYRTLSTFSDQGLGDSVSLSTLKSIKRKLSKRLHPDLGGSQDEFMQMLEAMDLVQNEVISLLPTISQDNLGQRDAA